MKKQTKVAIIIISIVLVVLLGIGSTIIILTPKTDNIKNDSIPERHFITNCSYIDYQESNDCSAYAAAYVLRSLGKDITGKELYPQMNRFFGMMTVRCVSKTIEKQGYSVKGYHGSIDTLKQRIVRDKPIICYIKDKDDMHFVVAVGYDSENIYLVDSIKENTNVFDSDLYNRKLEINEFKQLWKNKWYFCDNIYIVVE